MPLYDRLVLDHRRDWRPLHKLEQLTVFHPGLPPLPTTEFQHLGRLTGPGAVDLDIFEHRWSHRSLYLDASGLTHRRIVGRAMSSAMGELGPPLGHYEPSLPLAAAIDRLQLHGFTPPPPYTLAEAAVVHLPRRTPDPPPPTAA